MNNIDLLLDGIKGSSQAGMLRDSKSCKIELKGVCGSLWGLLISLIAKERGGLHLVVFDNKDDACYAYNDIYNVMEYYNMADNHVFLFPTAYKRSILSLKEDSSSISLRTQTLSALVARNYDPLILCTWAEALGETVACKKRLEDNSRVIRKGDHYCLQDFYRLLVEKKFTKVDFVSEPGQYAMRGGIIDVFSFGDSKPYRIEFFDDEIESIRTFKVVNQLSDGMVDKANITMNVHLSGETQVNSNVSLMEFIGENATIWANSPKLILDSINTTRASLLKIISNPQKIDELYISGRIFVNDVSKWNQISLYGSIDENSNPEIIKFDSRPQPSFNKDFKILANNIKESQEHKIETFILSDNKAQFERLDDIFKNLGDKRIEYKPCRISLHNGFCMDLISVYTDHQIFERYQRYKIYNDVDRSESMTISELNAMKMGDYVVHIDYGIGQFGGLIRSTENGITKEFIKLTYLDGDVLMVGVSNLHKLSKYRSSDDGVHITLHRLGSGAWARTKAVAKSRIKEIAIDLIKLYAERKAQKGFAYSPDSFLQHELEASFEWEDTPDQLAATEAVKKDMESPMPMDRLICGDVGFGKTEIAIRAAVKAVADGKQVAVMVPTTILAFQHYKTFSSRLKTFPIVVESLSRTKTAKEVRDIIRRLGEGKIDIIIGTHKLLGKEVNFKDLGLLIIDEEQKFGVRVKEKLREQRTSIDTLTMTATPIPRTLQFSLMGARDLSMINVPPPNRQPVATMVQPFSEVILAETIRYEINRGGQVFFLHNRVDSINSMALRVQNVVPEARIAVAHGQMKPAELEKIVMDFIYGEYNVLVSTSIVENGIDIPNANTMIINNAHLFGLSDLHQLRGRVGRGNRKAYCYLFIPSFEALTSDSARRLRAIEEFSDLGSGFSLAMQDLDIRGAGNIFGAEQSGFITEMGYETYQKILTETIDELKMEQGIKAVVEKRIDCHVETSIEAYLPDEYIGSTSEKIRLYKELDSITSDNELAEFVSRIKDRFGEVPSEAQNLIDIVRLRNMASIMGIEKISLNPPRAKITFTDNQDFPFFATDKFEKMMLWIVKHPYLCRAEQIQNQNKKIKLILHLIDIRNIDCLKHILYESCN